MPQRVALSFTSPSAIGKVRASLLSICPLLEYHILTLSPAIHPTLATEGGGLGVHAEFSWNGTKDYTPWLSTFAALEFFNKAGGVEIMNHNRELAAWGGKLLMDSWKTNYTAKGEDALKYFANMVALRVPVDKTFATVRTRNTCV